VDREPSPEPELHAKGGVPGLLVLVGVEVGFGGQALTAEGPIRGTRWVKGRIAMPGLHRSSCERSSVARSRSQIPLDASQPLNELYRFFLTVATTG